MAKSIAATLEGSNPATSKFHKKKQNLVRPEDLPYQQLDHSLQNQQGYYSENENCHSDRHGSGSGNGNLGPYANNYLYDESLPDVIKRSIAQASQINPVRMIHAPDSCKQLHYTEHTSHTEMPPKAAMSLAAALESEMGRGGRGAQIFQKRKAKSEKWVVDESNVRRPPGQHSLPNTPLIKPVIL